MAPLLPGPLNYCRYLGAISPMGAVGSPSQSIWPPITTDVSATVSCFQLAPVRLSGRTTYLSVMTNTKTATFAGGCFWCIEAAFDVLDGVVSTTSGYAGGRVEDPTYQAVCRGDTGHAEVVQVAYDPTALSYEDLLEVFFTIHDPTTADRQGPDVGSQYRPAIFYHDEEQRRAATEFVENVDASDAYDDPIVTEIEPLDTFYEAEAHHQDYFEKNPKDAYCQFHAAPKVEKVRERFA